jgi:UDP-glucose 4-epimerase
MKILVTGGAGFIGRHLVQRLEKKKHKVLVVDNLSAKSADKTGIKNFKKADVRRYQSMKYMFRTFKPDIVYHLAALARVRESIENPKEAFTNNCLGTHNLLMLSTIHGVKKFVFMSSREIFGSAKYLPVDEQHSRYSFNPYAASKQACESYVQSFHKSQDLDYIIIRPANVFGPGDFERVIPDFIMKASKGNTLKVFGGDQILDFNYIDNNVDGLVACLNKKVKNEDFNLGSGRGMSIMDLATFITERFGKGKIKRMPGIKGEVDKYIANTEKAQKKLRYKPKVSFEEGIDKTHVWLRDRGDAF